jgi:hypothetical protein
MGLRETFSVFTSLCLLSITAFADGELSEIVPEQNANSTNEVAWLMIPRSGQCTIQETENAAPPEEDTCGVSQNPFRIEIGNIEAKGIGYDKGYTSLTGFFTIPNTLTTLWIPFLDLRGHIFNDGKLAANAGLGVRYLTAWAWGLNAYYDYRNTHRQHYNQVSLGMEALGQQFDFRVNGYLPVGRKTSPYYKTYFKKFKGQNAILSRKQEFAMKGLNAEVGYHIPEFKYIALYAAAGPYYFEGQGKNAWGGEARFDATFFDYLRLQVNSSYDNVFHGVIQGAIDIIIPFGGKKKIKKRNGYSCNQEIIVRKRALQQVDRQEIIVVDKKHHREKAINPATGQPYIFWFVDNTSHSNGTFESPFNTLLAAQDASSPNDIIYVFPGDSTSTGMNEGIILKDNQNLWSSTSSQTLNTSIGAIQIPILSPGQLYYNNNPPNSFAMAPVITSTTGDVITLANDNEISGFYIENLTGSALTGSNVNNLTIINSVIQGPDTGQTMAPGINLSNVQGNVLIASNLIFQGATGIQITGTNIQNTNYIITNNDCPAIGSLLVCTYTDSANISTTISRNTFNSYTSPIIMTFDNATAQQASSININSNQFNADAQVMSGECLLFTLNNYASVNAYITSNALVTPAANAVTFLQNDNSQLNLTMNNNNFFSWLTSLYANMSGASQLTGSISQNNLLFDASSGIFISASGSCNIENFSITNNNITGTLETYDGNSNAIFIEVKNTATANAFITGNQLRSGTNGAVFLTQNSSSMNISLRNNTILHPQIYGISFTTEDSSSGIWNVSNNTIIAPGGGSVFGGNDMGAALIECIGGTTTLNFTNNLAAPIQIPLITPSPEVGTYQFTRTGGTFYLKPLIGNIGTVTETGTITPIP